VQKTFYKVADFISWQKAKSLRLAPEFQRRSVWKPGAKSYLIDTIVRDLPIPILFIRDRRTDPNTFESMREVVDGQQRLRTVLSYVAPELLADFNQERDSFTVKKSHNSELAGKRFHELDNETKRRILDFEFSVHVLPSSIDDREVIQIFRRMNATNYSLKKQELRNASFFGEFKSCAYLLASEQLHRWRHWKSFSEDDIARMTEVEFTSEVLVAALERRVGGKSAIRIDKTYDKFDETFAEREQLEDRFRFVMNEIDKHFSSEAPGFLFFRKTVIYVFFMFVLDASFGLTTSLTKKVRGKPLTPQQVAGIKLASDRIKMKSAPEDVITATERRTTNPGERDRLFRYLKKLCGNA
jgi:hypothetical protein